MGFVPCSSGQIKVLGDTVQKALKSNLIAYVPQSEEVDWTFPVLVKDVVMMGRYGHMGFLRMPGKKDFEAVDNALAKVGMVEYAKRQIGELSGGQRKRIFLARSIAQNSHIILLDEPTNHIDLPTIGWLEQKLINIRTTMIVISHDQEFLKKIGTKTFWLSQGKLRKRDGKYEGFFEWSEELKEIEKNQVHKLKQKIKTETKWSIEGISARRKRNMGRIRELDKLNEDYSNLKVCLLYTSDAADE